MGKGIYPNSEAGHGEFFPGNASLYNPRWFYEYLAELGRIEALSLSESGDHELALSCQVPDGFP